ncbi:MAG: epimerase [Comamonadaceae bacterium]|nr:MAG: epimerase [Comamonadaceae bacterium]
MQKCMSGLQGSAIVGWVCAGHTDPIDTPRSFPMSRNTVLILGANGRLGTAAASAFADAGWRVLAQVRSTPTVADARIEWLAIPLADTDALAAAAAGARTVVHAINPIYTRWQAEVLPLGRLGMDVAHRLGADFLLPGNVYGFGSGMPARLRADTSELPDTRKGRIRVALEVEMRERATSGLRSGVIRAGDFFGGGPGSWFDMAIAKSAATGTLVYPGPLNLPHAWAYLPDLAAAFVAVAARGLPPGFTHLPFEGHTLTGRELLAAIEAAAPAAGLAAPTRGWKHRGMPWPLLRMGGLLVPMWRELAEMSYLWARPHALDGSALQAFAGPLPKTQLAKALTASLRALYPSPAVAPASARTTAA